MRQLLEDQRLKIQDETSPVMGGCQATDDMQGLVNRLNAMRIILIVMIMIMIKVLLLNLEVKLMRY